MIVALDLILPLDKHLKDERERFQKILYKTENLVEAMHALSKSKSRIAFSPTGSNVNLPLIT
jgi:hypothetical protein